MKTIITKFVGPTNTKGARIIAKAEGVPSVTIGYHSVDGNPHAVAAKKLKDKMGWSGKMVGGGLPNGDMAWVFKDDVEINPSRRKHMKKNPLKERIAAARHARSIRHKPGGRALARSVIAYGRGRGLLTKNPSWRFNRADAIKKVRAMSDAELLKAYKDSYAVPNNSWSIIFWKEMERRQPGRRSMKKNPRKRSSKRKLSPKQAAWRKEFARRVKAGLFKRGRKTRARIPSQAMRMIHPFDTNRDANKRSYYARLNKMKKNPKRTRRNPVRSKLLCLKHGSGVNAKWWYLHRDGMKLTDKKDDAKRFATDAAAINTAHNMMGVLSSNGFTHAKTRDS